MPYEQKDNTGALFRNEKKPEGSKHPDYKGKVRINGQDYDLAGWIAVSKDGSRKYISLTFSEPYQPKPKFQKANHQAPEEFF